MDVRKFTKEMTGDQQAEVHDRADAQHAAQF